MVKLICLPVLSTSLRSFTDQPACCSRSSAWRNCSRLLPEPSVTGSLNGSVNSAGGSSLRYGSSSFNSSPCGMPDEARSLLLK